MKTYTIPDGFIAPADTSPTGISIHAYSSSQGAVKTKVIINKVLISFLQEGEKCIHFADSPVSISAQQAVIIPSGNSLMTEKNSVNGNYKSMLFFFDKKNIADFLLRYHPSKKTAHHTNAVQSSFTFVIDDFVNNFLFSLQGLQQQGRKISCDMGQIKLTEILYYLGEVYGEPFTSFLTSIIAHPSELSLRKVVEDNIYTNLTLDEISFLCNMSRATFKRRFSKLLALLPINGFMING